MGLILVTLGLLPISFAVRYLEKKKTLDMMHASLHSVKTFIPVKHCKTFGNDVTTELH